MGRSRRGWGKRAAVPSVARTNAREEKTVEGAPGPVDGPDRARRPWRKRPGTHRWPDRSQYWEWLQRVADSAALARASWASSRAFGIMSIAFRTWGSVSERIR